MTANSSDRSKVILFDPKAKTENFRRSNHNDFATTAELKQRQFSGWRGSKLTDSVELWVLGEVVLEVTKTAMALDPGILEKKYNEYFKT